MKNPAPQIFCYASVTSPRRLLLAKEIRTVFTQTPLLIAALLGLGLPWVTQGQINPLPFVYAERFGVVNIIPNDQSGETGQDAEPSIAVGTGTHNGEFIVRAFRSGSNTRYYNSTDKGIHWITWPIDLPDIDGTIDWASGGTAYETDLTDKFGILAHNFFYGNLSYIPNSEYRPYYRAVDQPWLKAVTVNGVDHVYIGYNDFSEPNGRSASVRFFVDAGQTWGSCIVEKVTPNPINGHKQDSPAVRLAISPDGNTVYALFQEWNWGIGTDPNGDPIDRIGNIVVVRDDNVACTFDAVGSHAYADFYANLPWETSLGAQRIGSACDIALNPSNPNEVYEAHTRLSYATGLPSIVVARSQAGGGAGTFVGLREFKNASLPALAVTKDGTFGMLFAQMDGVNLKVMFWKSPKGDFNFNMGVLKTLAVWPNNNPGKIGNIYVGDYFQLKADGYNFYGTFCASGDPKCSNFPSGVYYQRNVNVAGVTKNNFWLKQDGGLVDLGGNSISPSIDPFFFYDIASTFVDVNVAVAWNNASAQAAPDDPFAGRNHFNWAVLPASSPQFQLESSLALGSSASWTIETNNLIQTNGQFYLAPDLTHPRQYFRLRQNVAGWQFPVFASAGNNGSLNPNGVLTNIGLSSRTFTATASNGYAVDQWYLDGVPVRTNQPTLTVSNISAEHIVLATFIPTNDLAVTVVGMTFGPEDPVLVSNAFTYQIDVANTGRNPLSGVTVTNILDPGVSFISATCTLVGTTNSIGTITNQGNLVLANLGALSNGVAASIILTVVPNFEGTITNVVIAACDQFEPDLANNTAVATDTVLDPVTIVSDLTDQTANPGDTVTFSVSVSGTPPFDYQWFFNDVPLNDDTNADLILPNVTTSNVGYYSVTVSQTPGPEAEYETDSRVASLTVGGIGPITLPAGGNRANRHVR